MAKIFSADEYQSRLNTRMFTRTNSPIVLADVNKCGHRLTFRVATLPAATHIISDTLLSGDRLSQLRDIGCSVTLTGPQW